MIVDILIYSAGLGCGLFEEENDAMRVSRYGRRILVGSGEKYHSSKIEFLALKWVVCDTSKIVYSMLQRSTCMLITILSLMSK